MQEKIITIPYNGTDYRLGFNRKSVEALERSGFRVSNLEGMPITAMFSFFEGAFLMNHKFVKKEIIEEIYKKIPNKPEMIELLAEIYNDTITAFYDDPSDEGKLEWKASW